MPIAVAIAAGLGPSLFGFVPVFLFSPEWNRIVNIELFGRHSQSRVQQAQTEKTLTCSHSSLSRALTSIGNSFGHRGRGSQRQGGAPISYHGAVREPCKEIIEKWGHGEPTSASHNWIISAACRLDDCK